MQQCRVVHRHAVVAGLDKNLFVGTTLIDGYGKAGLVFEARRVFNENLSELNIISWNAIMAGYAQQGDKNLVLELFHLLETRAFVQDEYSFLAVLTTFSYAGLDFESEKWMERMRVEYGLEPALHHYTCLILAVGRAGRLEDAERIAMAMPFEPDAVVWKALLSCCAAHGVADMVWKMAQRLLQIYPYDDSAYLMVANVLSSA
ncbi:hypothetical protein Pint_33101 [Pistacia integerrima]|uniref:Uncharacterized protein n=1 Tax=Pistacia integerrima TaxID=434235 RepID=A0ACC0X6N5_9ROSI|nr:hypothetical protein Pint_33101 [Pistacia integerrima]